MRNFPRATYHLAGLVVLCASSAMAQNRTPAASNPGVTSGGTTTSPNNPGASRFPTTTTNPNTTNTPMPEMNRPIMIQGKVMLSTGTPPPQQVTIQRVCGSRITTEGYTDSKGRFSFNLGERMGVMPDASDNTSGGFGPGGFGGGGMSSRSATGMGGGQNLERSLFNCELVAVLPGYRAQSVNLAGRRSMDNPDVGTIIMHRIEGVEGLTVSATSELAPKDAKKVYEKGLDRARKGKFEEAQADFQKAVEIYPKYAMAWSNLGSVQERLGQSNEARQSFEQALKIDGKLVDPYMHLATLSAKDQKWEEVATFSDKLIRLDPVDYPQAYYLNAGAKLNLRKLDEAEKSARQGVKIDEQHKLPALRHVLGMVLMQKENYTEAATEMKAYLAQAPNASNADLVKKQLAEAEKFADKTEVSQQKPE